MISEPLAEEADCEPVEEIDSWCDALTAAIDETEPKKPSVNAAHSLFQFINLILNDIKDQRGQCSTQTALAHWPLSHNMDQCFLEYDPAAGKIS
jgi:hypothetical protein